MAKEIPQFLNYFLQDCLNGNPDFSIKSMFGGHAIYKNGKIFALYAFEEIYFKVGDNNLEDYLEKKSRIFEYDKKGKIMTISYYTLPEEIFEDNEELNIWIEKSLEVENKCKYSIKSKKNLELDDLILKKLLDIPTNKVTTYKILADIFEVHPRRVASVMKQNKNPDIFPCYKVISHSGKINGYSGPNGLDSKIELLKQDGIKIIDGKIENEFIEYFNI